MEEDCSKKSDIIKISRQLFYTKGYSNTSIQNIIDIANIAKGTFYHYFKSKEDLLNQLTDIDVDGLYSVIEKIEKMQIDAKSKLLKIFQSATSWKNDNISALKPLIKVIISDSNLILRNNILQHQNSKLAPLYARIISQGVDEGVFHVRDKEYTSKFLICSFDYYGNQVYKFFEQSTYSKVIEDEFINLLRNFEDTIERLLGTHSGSIKIAEDEIVRNLYRGLMEA